MQRALFDTEPLGWEVDSQTLHTVATVVMATGPELEFDYLVPPELADPRRPEQLVEPGRRVRASLGKGNRSIVAYCVAVETKPTGGRTLKPLLEVLDPVSLLSPAMLRLTRWMADHYLAPWGQVLEAVVPSGVRGRAGTREVTLLSVPTNVAAKLTTLEVTDQQRKALELLTASPKPLTTKQLMHRADCGSGPISTLRKKGFIHAHVERLDSSELAAEAIPRRAPQVLNPDQVRALGAINAALDSKAHRTLLLHGVTGSGKTEVYIQAIEKVVSFGRQAIVLVPEISLTPQTVGRFRERFDHIAVLHSHQSDVERHRHWKRIVSGEVQVVVGARSAVFAPTRYLGLIVIDEEHETSFKQDSAPRYHAREVALQRAAAEAVPLVLASATPSLESWHSAMRGESELVEMPRRVNDLPLPTVRTIDLREETHRRTPGAISRPLSQAIEAALRDGGQVILLLNRRGYCTQVKCDKCGYVLECPECELALTFHRTNREAICHYCDYRTTAPTICPDCKDANIRYSGMGTQKLEAEVRAKFASAHCLRMDTDTMKRPGSHEVALDAFRKGEFQILLGTQMIAKGLDFPNVTLVGVINADTALHWPDFRAAERTFHLVTQVAGRTGRGEKGGRVYVQTFDPEHPAIAAAAKHDYHAFARQELPQREALGYPPFGSLARIIARGPNDQQASAFIDQVAEQFRKLAEGAASPVRTLGPAPAPMAKLRGNYRYHLQAQCLDAAELRRLVRELRKTLMPPAEVQWVADLDPWDMM